MFAYLWVRAQNAVEKKISIAFLNLPLIPPSVRSLYPQLPRDSEGHQVSRARGSVQLNNRVPWQSPHVHS